MTLVAILAISLMGAVSAPGVGSPHFRPRSAAHAADAAQAAPGGQSATSDSGDQSAASQPVQSTQPQDQPATDSSAQNSPATADQAAAPPVADQTPAPEQKPSTGHKPRTKKPASGDCAKSPKPTRNTVPGEAAVAPLPASACPPTKKVIRNGGTSEPTVQLTGDMSGEQASHQRSTTDQLLASTEDNLKKAGGQSLTSGQEDSVKQIRQFIGQAKSAAAAGDLDRARNLALKAHLLSDEVLKP